MRQGTILAAVSEAVQAARLRDLPDRKFKIAGKNFTTRPDEQDLVVSVFLETWPSTALGYGGMGGSAMTDAYTVIVGDPHNNIALIYWGSSRLGRTVGYREGIDMARAQNSAIKRARRQEKE